MDRRRTFWLFLALAATGLFMVIAAELRFFLDRPIADLGEGRIVFIPPRSTLHETAAILEREGIIPGQWIFNLSVRLLGLGSSLRWGEYRFSGSLSVKQIIDTLVSGKVYLHRITLPEGLTVQQIADRIESEGLGKADEIVRTALDPEVAARLGLPGPGLEGFCYPETYHFPRDWPAEKILEAMVGRFREVFDKSVRAHAEAKGMGLKEVVTLASIIEKESWAQSEMPVISAVFHNRLRKEIPLMADPVVIYGIKNFDGNLRKADLQRPGDYNVYLNKGLPPTPISNPGLPALLAAVNPAPVDFLFFVSKNNGTHYFSRYLSEHNRAVAMYQRGHK